MAMASTKKEHIMDRENELIDLGVVSADTKGLSPVTTEDDEGGWKPHGGLAAD
jgi:hypothetical protein